MAEGPETEEVVGISGYHGSRPLCWGMNQSHWKGSESGVRFCLWEPMGSDKGDFGDGLHSLC